MTVLAGTSIKIKKGEPSQKIFVVATTYKRFQEWCEANDLNRKSLMVKYIRRDSDLHGEVNCWYKDLGATYIQGQWVYDMLERYKKHRGFKEIP